MTIVVNILISVTVLGVLGLVLGAVCAAAGCTNPDGSTVQTDTEKVPEKEEEAKTRLRAFVKCAGAEAEIKYTYVGSSDCFEASMFAGGYKACGYSCLGLGSCSDVCEAGAISAKNGVAEVDAEKCTGCGKCVGVCPRGVIEMIPADAAYAVRCNNEDLGSQTRKICEFGCIGCLACAKNCKYDAVEVNDSIAHIDYSKCDGCGKCAEVCLRGIITAPPAEKPEEEPFDESEYFALQIEDDEAQPAKEEAAVEE